MNCQLMNQPGDGWHECNRHHRCVGCGKANWCGFHDDGAARCMRQCDTPSGYRLVKISGDGGRTFVPDDGARRVALRPLARVHVNVYALVNPDLERWAEEFAEAAARNRWLERIGQQLGGIDAGVLRGVRAGYVDGDGLQRLKAGGAGWKHDYPNEATAFPEIDGAGRMVGFSLRAIDGRKGAASGKIGARRGLVAPLDLASRPDPVFIVEGASDVAAGLSIGMTCVGRPANILGAPMLADLLRGRACIVLAENDEHFDANGRLIWPGKTGAEVVARELQRRWGRAVPVQFPPRGSKDLRAWVLAKRKGADQ